MDFKNDDSDKMLLSRLNDLCKISKKSNIVKFTGFLNEKEQYLTESFAAQHDTPFVFFGGYPDAIRKIAAFGNVAADFAEIFPISTVTFFYRPQDKLSNRDFLGAVMSLGIKRQLLGDIIVGEGYAVIFCSNTIKPLLLYQLEKVRKTSVRAEPGVLVTIPEKKFDVMRCILASLRLDCFTAEVTHLSREKAIRLIKSKSVQMNYSVCEENSKAIKPGDIISIKGYGKFIFCETDSLTKKGHVRIIVEKYV